MNPKKAGAVIIPARFASSRLPGKPLADIGGKPMIHHVYERCAEAVGISNVIIATDDERIRSVSESFGAKTIMTSVECQTGTDRLAEANRSLKFDFVVNVQGDEPLIKPGDIRAVYDRMRNGCEDVVNCYCEVTHYEKASPSVPKVVINRNGDLLYMSRASIPSDKYGESHCRFKQVCIYGFTAQHLEFFADTSRGPLESVEDIEILRFIESGIGVKMVAVDSGTVAVDTLEDLEVVRSLCVA